MLNLPLRKLRPLCSPQIPTAGSELADGSGDSGALDGGQRRPGGKASTPRWLVLGLAWLDFQMLVIDPEEALGLPKPPHTAVNGINCPDCCLSFGSLSGPIDSAVSVGGLTSLADVTMTWTNNEWVGSVVWFVDGANEGLQREITKSTENQLG
jgi:hypothetical protein